MLQPRQLERVEARHRAQIAALREFLVFSEVPLHTLATLPLLTSRLAADRAFRRDLRSSLWLAAYADHREAEPADLVGMLALAAAGPAQAADAGDDEAHQLLLFAMEVRALAPLPHATATTVKASRRWQWAACVTLAVLVLPPLFVRHFVSHQPEPANAISPAPPAVARQVAPDSATASASALTAPPPASLEGHASSSLSARATRAAVRGPILSVRSGTTRPPSFAAGAGNGSSPAVRAIPTQPLTGVARLPTDAGSTPPPTTASPLLQRSTNAPAPVPSAVLSRRLDARTLPPDYASDTPRTYPRLLRRRPLLPLAADTNDGTTLLAANETPTAANLAGSGAARRTIGGTVRPVSLGTMAANVLYSPAPAYPPAAAAAHVQGQVTVQAEVDRNGNVAAVRVVSGPPLLRDAAVDAVQRWRYRPYRSAGKPVSASATAVMDFELP